MGTEFFIAIEVFPVELFNVMHCKLARIALFIYSVMTSLVISFNADICKR